MQITVKTINGVSRSMPIFFLGRESKVGCGFADELHLPSYMASFFFFSRSTQHCYELAPSQEMSQAG